MWYVTTSTRWTIYKDYQVIPLLLFLVLNYNYSESWILQLEFATFLILFQFQYQLNVCAGAGGCRKICQNTARKCEFVKFYREHPNV